MDARDDALWLFNPGEGHRLQQALAKRMQQQMLGLLELYISQKLTPLQAYAGIAGLAALRGVYSEVQRQANEDAQQRNEQYGGRLSSPARGT